MSLNKANKSGLTDWENEPKLADLQADFQSCKPSHDQQIAKIAHWQDLLNVTGSERPPHIKGRSKVQPKLVRRQAEWRYSALTEPFLGSHKLLLLKLLKILKLPNKMNWY